MIKVSVGGPLARGEHFDPDVVDVFFENIYQILKIKYEVDADGDVSLPGL